MTLTGTLSVTGHASGTHPALYARDGVGNLWQYRGTGEAAPYPFSQDQRIGTGYQNYTALTSLSGQQSDGTGDLVARDKAGTLWYYRGSGKSTAPLRARIKVSPGWNIYNRLVGVGDVTGDHRADLLGRDSAGVLWLYRGTGSQTAPFAKRTRVGSGWNTYNQLVGAGDLTGDGRADLLGRDSAGVLWLYRGTGSQTAPFAKRTRVGSGWNTYNLLIRAGDADGGGRTDLFARDATGTLWLYSGTGIATTPFTHRVKVGTGWNNYNALL
jgi:hypothetical protein